MADKCKPEYQRTQRRKNKAYLSNHELELIDIIRSGMIIKAIRYVVNAWGDEYFYSDRNRKDKGLK